ncbi:Rieske 2Fe-2S domain-containing protein [Alloacidobacterium dinghuense]|uniref:Rieske 2Fe-2S domain-containing protein n=1 Tax=Alloacidobacterium dinghuense TaxID=2763107 RepID=A0A7G8BHM4_9BACT|nr:Rieske 2Fe-2S domain-containing protein [Alloacidobacterium dinghuense]QNI32044.1 Rieske 2Fe-2S domain-containing protein [Alloacidobacterium dinghuense]
MSEEKGVTRRSLLMGIGIAFNAIVGVAIAVPVIGYLLSPVKKKSAYNQWISLGKLDQFPEGQTRLADFVNPFKRAQDGETANTPCWVRRVSTDQFQVFAINCAHLGCPVRWFPQSELFMCPCHGGVYYADGARASGPPERGLFTYEYKVEKGELHINAGLMPTLADQSKLVVIDGKGKSPCLG